MVATVVVANNYTIFVRLTCGFDAHWHIKHPIKGAIFMPKIHTKKENKQMNDFNKRNYYALFISIVKNETAKEALSDMGICPDNVKEEE